MSDRFLYSEADLEMYLPTIWGMDPRAPERERPDHDMPKADVDPRSVSNAWTVMADVHRAWEQANLTKRQRQVIYLRFCWDDLLDDIANTLGVTSKGTVAEHLDRGLANMLLFLNGRTRLEMIA